MKLLIVDDHPVVRDGLAALLRQLGPEVTVLLAEDGPQGLGLANGHPDLDLVVLDLAMPDSDGFATLQEFGRLQPQLLVVVVSSSEDPRDVRRALTAGALGYIPKSAPPRTILAAVQFVLDGVNYGDPVALSGDTAFLTTSLDAVGNHTFSAVFVQDNGNFKGSVSAELYYGRR